MARKIGARAVLHAVHGFHPVSGQCADAFGAVDHVGAGHGASVLGHPGVAPEGVSPENAHQVEDVRPQDPQILAAPSAVLLAAAAEFQNPAQASLGDQVLDHLDLGAVAGLVSDGQLDVGTFAGLHHGVRLGQSPAHGFFQEDAGSVLGAGQHHVVVAVQPPGRHAHDLRTFLPQHLPVV